MVIVSCIEDIDFSRYLYCEFYIEDIMTCDRFLIYDVEKLEKDDNFYCQLSYNKSINKLEVCYRHMTAKDSTEVINNTMNIFYISKEDKPQFKIICDVLYN